ncbi:Protein TRACHEARY ELEMENT DIFFERENTIATION-RELATED 6, partial [Cucurbita argyrosperma subsp. sororia]
MAAQNTSNLGRISPPPPPSPSPNGHTAVIVIVFISLGSCLLFFTFVAAAFFCCFIKKRNKKPCPRDEVAEVIHVDGHRKVHEDVAQDAHGRQAVMVTIEDDVHIDEIAKKKEHRHGFGLHGKHEGSNSSTIQVPPSSSTLDSNVTHHQS